MPQMGRKDRYRVDEHYHLSIPQLGGPHDAGWRDFPPPVPMNQLDPTADGFDGLLNASKSFLIDDSLVASGS